MENGLISLDEIAVVEENYSGNCEDPYLNRVFETARAAHEWEEKYEAMLTCAKNHAEGRSEILEENEKLREDRDRWKEDAMMQTATIHRFAEAMKDRNEVDAIRQLAHDEDIAKLNERIEQYESENTHFRLALQGIKGTVDKEVAALKEQLRGAHSLKEKWKLTKLITFKEYVHDRLDKAGIPIDPEPSNNQAHGCRIEGRLNYLFEQLRVAKALVEALDNESTAAWSKELDAARKALGNAE